MIPINYPELSVIFIAIILITGLVFLFLGGEFLCKGAESLALILGINPVIIGLTIVAVATSMPELFTSFYSALDNSPDIAVGNIVGSNLANIGLILGVSALVAPIRVHARLVQIEVPFLLLITILFGAMAYTGTIQSWHGWIFISILVVYLYIIVSQSKKEDPIVEEAISMDVDRERLSPLRSWLYILGGAICLHFGAEFLVDSAVESATRLGVSEVLIGLTIVAVGTSLPELAASLSAARRGQADICAGNIVGSNIFNILLVGGSVSTILPLKVAPSLMNVEFPIMILLTIILWAFFASGKVVSKREGIILLLAYIATITTTCLIQYS